MQLLGLYEDARHAWHHTAGHHPTQPDELVHVTIVTLECDAVHADLAQERNSFVWRPHRRKLMYR